MNRGLGLPMECPLSLWRSSEVQQRVHSLQSGWDVWLWGQYDFGLKVSARMGLKCQCMLKTGSL